MRDFTEAEMKRVGGCKDVFVVTGKRTQSWWEKQQIMDALQPARSNLVRF
jgi:hypothetical protein